MGFYRDLGREAWAATFELGRRQGALLGILGALLSAVLYAVLVEPNWGAAFVGPLGAVGAFALLFVWNFILTPARVAARSNAAIEALEDENQHLRQKLTPTIRFQTDNTPEYDRIMEVDVYDRATSSTGKEEHSVKLLKLMNLSAQSLVVHAQITGIDPPLVEGSGPPIRLRWRDGNSGMNTLPAGGFDYVILHPPIPDFDLWSSLSTRTVRVSAWVSGGPGISQEFRLDYIRAGAHPWVTAVSS